MIGQKILLLRQEAQISRYELAKHIGVTDQAIKYWEENINEPKATHIKNLAQFFDVSADYLLDLEDIAGRKTPSELHHCPNKN